MKANKKYKGLGGNSQYRVTLRRKHDKAKALKKERRLCHGKNEPEPKSGYILTYKADMTDRTYTFANLHKIKLVDTISIYSNVDDRSKINDILKNRKNWPYNNEISYIDYKYIKSEICPEPLKQIRNAHDYLIELSQNKVTLTKSLLDQTRQKDIRVYTCFTNLRYLKYLNKKYSTKAWIFDNGIISQTNKNITHRIRYIKLNNIKSYVRLINLGIKIVITDPRVATKCIKLSRRLGHRIEYIYDSKMIPRFETKHNKIRKHIYTESEIRNQKLAQEKNNTEQRMVCITDGKSVHRLKYLRAKKIVERFPLKISFCEKYVYNNYLKKLDEGKVKQTSKQGSKDNPSDTRTRKDRRLVSQKHKLYSRHYKSQFIETWEPDETGEFEYYVGGKTITQYIKSKPLQRQTRSKYSLSNRKTKKPSMFKQVETETKGIKINKFPYNKPIVVQYIETDKDGVIHHKREENVKMMNKKIIKHDPKTNEDIVLCPVKDVEKWVHQEDYIVDKEGNIKSEWIPYIEIIPIKKVKNIRIPFHLPKKIKKTKQWHNPYEQDINIYGRHCDIIRRKIKNNKQSEIRNYLTNLLKSMSQKHRTGFTWWVRDEELTLHKIIQNAMGSYINEKYINTPMRDFLIGMELPF